MVKFGVWPHLLNYFEKTTAYNLNFLIQIGENISEEQLMLQEAQGLFDINMVHIRPNEK